MTALVQPDVRWFPSWAVTVEDFGDPVTMHGAGFWNLGFSVEPTEESFAAVLRMVEETAPGDPATGKVPSTYFWITAGDGGPGDEVIGFLNLRHELNDFLLEEGGHIGYSVRPSARRQGHATRALDLAVKRCAELGIDRVLVTCDDDNEASRKTIERCGGVYEDTRNGKLRFWIDVA